MHITSVHTWNIVSCDNLFANGLVVDPDVHLIAATESSGEGDLDKTVAGGRGGFNNVSNDSGRRGALVSNTTPKAV